MAEPGERGDREWEPGWEAHTRAQRRRLARLTLAEKLEWLESAQRVVNRLMRRRADGRADPPSDP